MEKAEEANPTAFKSYKQADSFGNALGYAAETVGEIGPDIAAFVGSMLTGSFGAGALARRGTAQAVEGLAEKLAARKGIDLAVAREAVSKQITGALAEQSAKTLGSKVGIGAASAGINIPDTLQGVYEDTGELRPDLALTIGSLVAALDTYLPGKILAQLGPAGKAKLAEEMIKKSSVVPTTWKKEFGKALGITAAGEGLTEGTQESLQIFANQLAGSKDPFFSSENIDRIINSMFKGVIGGGVVGAPGAAVEASQVKADRLANIAAQPTQQEQEQVAPSARDLISKAREEKQRIATQQINQPPVGEKSAFETQQPDLLGFYKNLEQKPPQAAPKEIDPLAQRTRELFEEFVSKGMPPAQATRQAYEQARAEQQNDKMYSVESGEVADPRIANPRQGVLQFAPPAPEAKPDTQIANQLQAAQKLREINLAHQQAVQEKQAQVEKIAQQAKAQQQLNLAGLLPEQKTFRPPTANGVPAAQQQPDLFGKRGRPSRTEGIRQGQTQSLQEDLMYQEPQQSTVLDAETLKKTGLKPQSGYYKQLLGLDMANPDDQIKIGQILTAARQNTRMDKAPIESLRNQAFTTLAQQQSLPLTEATRGTKPPATVSRPNGKSVPVSNRPAPPAGRPAPIKPAGVGVFENVATGLGAREKVQPSTLVPPVKKELTLMEKATLQAERDLAKKKKKAEEKAELEAKKAKEKAEVKEEPKVEVKEEPKTPAELQAAINYFTPMLGTSDLKEQAEIKKIISDLTAQLSALEPATPKKAEESDYYKNKKAEEAREKATPVGNITGTYVQKLKEFGKRLGSVKVHNYLQDSAKNEKILAAAKKGDIKAALDELSKSKNPLYRQIANIAKNIKDLKIEVDDNKSETQAKKLEGASDTAKINIAILDALREAKRRVDAGEKLSTVGKEVIAVPKGLVEEVKFDQSLANTLHWVDIFKDKNTFYKYVAEEEKAAKDYEKNNRILAGYSGIETTAVGGMFDPVTNTIYLHSYWAKREGVFAHELTHAITNNFLHNPKNKNIPAYRAMEDLYKHVKENYKGKVDEYGLTNLDEFVAEGFTNPTFQYELAKMKYKNTSGLSKFIDTIARILGLKNDNALTELLNLGFTAAEEGGSYKDNTQVSFNLLTPDPTLRNKPNVPGVTNADAQSIFDKFIDKIATAPMMNQNRANALHEVFKKGVFGNALTVILSSLPVNVLGMEAERAGLKGATGIGKLIDEQSNYINGKNEIIEPVVRKAEAWAKQATPEMVKLLNSVIYGSTTSKADPTKEKTDYPGATQKDKIWSADYDKVKAEYIRLTDSGKKLYVDMRNAYSAMYEDIVKAINERIETFSVDDTVKEKMKADIMAKLVAQGKIEPYFALTRKGNYWLSYNMRDKSGQVEPYIEAFEYERARTKAVEQLKKEGATDIEQFSKLTEYQYRRAPSGSFVNNVLQVLNSNKPKPPANPTAEEKEKYEAALEKYEQNTEEVMRLYISTMPETSFAQSFRKRQNVLGYKEDAIEALRDRLYSTAQQVGRMVYGAKINKLMADMIEASKKMTKGTDSENSKDNKLVNEYIKIFEKHIAANSANNNNIVTKLANLTNTLTFGEQLGFNISSAVVQVAQVPMVVMPYLAGEHNWNSVIKEIGAARKAFFASGYSKTAQMIGSKEKVTGKAMPSMNNYDFDDPKLPANIKKLKTLYDLASGEGQLNRSSFYDVLEVDGRKNILNTVNATSGWMFHHADRMNREISLMAAYNLQLDKLHGRGIKGQAAEDAAARYAVDAAKLTNGNIAAGNAPLISKNALGKVLFMYKGYGVSMYYLLFKVLRDILQKQDKDVRRIAMRQMGGIFGSAALFSGLQGLPMFGTVAMMYNLFADDDEDDLETATRKYTGEFMYKGLINEITGLDVAGRIGLSDLIFRTNPTSQSATFQDALLQTFGGPAYGAGSKIMRGINKIHEGNVERGIEDIVPAFLGNAMKSYRYGTEGATTMRGDPMIEDFSVFSVGAQALGFTPAELSLQQAINAKTKGIEKAILDKKNKLLMKYNISSREGDNEARDEYKEKLLELNDKHPGLGINSETFERSRRAFKESSDRMKNGVQYSKKLEQEMLDNIAAYD
jgi:hypothetical protein